ncbi:MAG: molybdenum cofactor biosynthesis protein MoaE [Rhodospirillales bacterium]|nr:MAG: molybdenum cofactor biosynthesis protein MoaE [Rhodospirillales bacterium]
MIRVQREDFSVGAEIDRLCAGGSAVGGVAVFIGLVRDVNDDRAVQAMILEHYPGMTERELDRLEQEARRRWPLQEVLIIHRFGRLVPSDRIVLVAATSAHRDAAFDACRFLIDWLKTRAPFWKQEETGQGRQWVVARESDADAAARWSPIAPGGAGADSRPSVAQAPRR